MTKKLYIKTYGCQMNVYDSQRMSDVLSPLGYESTDAPEDADLVILNTCHIREKASEKMYSDLGRMRIHQAELAKSGRRMLLTVAGCVAQAEGEEITARAPYVDMVVGPQSYHALPEMIAESEKVRKSQVRLEFVEEAKFDLLPEATQSTGASAFVSVQEGCDKFCTFCVVPYTRGAEFSRPVDAIEREVRQHVERGVIEVTLLGQNVNAYHGVWGISPSPVALKGAPTSPKGEVALGQLLCTNGEAGSATSPLGEVENRSTRFSGEGVLVEGEASLAQLIRRLAKIPELKRIRYTTSHPRDMTDDLIAAHGDIEILMPYLHLPVQSGSNRILKAMNRKHTAAEYMAIIEKLRQVRPDIAFSSDFIVGFPGETDADHADSLALIEAVGFAASYSFTYSPRPGTPAAGHAEQVDKAVKDARLQQMQELITRLSTRFNHSKIGTVQTALMERPGKYGAQQIGKSPYMQSVVIENAVDYMGQLVDVQITEAYANCIKGEVINSTLAAPTPLLAKASF
jgi:tRNA-2-methylthio-N6-dimethylallyladenosine synthase